MDLALEAAFAVIKDHAAAARTQVGVIVHTEKDIQHAVLLGDGAEKSAHNYSSPVPVSPYSAGSGISFSNIFFSACSGTGIGYSPEKQASQKPR